MSAVSLVDTLNTFLFVFYTGIATGASVIVANYRGMGNPENCTRPARRRCHQPAATGDHHCILRCTERHRGGQDGSTVHGDQSDNLLVVESNFPDCPEVGYCRLDLVNPAEQDVEYSDSVWAFADQGLILPHDANIVIRQG